ncbi:hypothetical protein J3R30DRAFT_3698414 [Lentinula aciculospora]|uniref:Uncharacterized protein n=1 Tax=Lentinula aciculospora TaxID=153920 RepID=A0A9W9AKG5_9AGAR|nr:hypothetical protein J3R30DRAFT_3698414 [Lentinula aciculospora]
MVSSISAARPRRVRSGCTPSETLKRAPSLLKVVLKLSSSSPSLMSSSTSTTSISTSASTSTSGRVRMNDGQRKARLQNDPDVLPNSVRQRTVACRGCRHTIRLDTKINYGDANWKTHKKRCAELKQETATAVDILQSLKTEVRLKGTAQQGSETQDMSELEYSAVRGLLDIQRKFSA